MLKRIAGVALFATLLITTAALAAPAANAPRDVVAAQAALHAAVSRGTLQDILAARARFAALAVTAPKSPWAHYWVALSDWRATPRFEGTSKALAAKTCAEGVAEIDKAIVLSPTEGEFHALRTSLLGMSLQFNPSAMMTIGPDLEASMNRALKLSPDNPRVQLFAGINTFSKPAFIGGGADKSLPVFAKSQALFAKAAVADSTAPHWGADDAWIWGGRAAMQLGDAKAAREAYHHALALTPGHAWVTHDLLPEAEAAAARDTTAKQPAASDAATKP